MNRRELGEAAIGADTSRAGFPMAPEAVSEVQASHEERVGR